MSLFAKDDKRSAEYSYMDQYTNRMKPMTRELFGREHEIQMVMAAMLKPEYCNVLLLGEAGSGKTALVQGIMIRDIDRIYLEVDLSKMIANLKNENEMADRLKTLFNEVTKFHQAEKKEIVLFIDEFHQIVQLSPAAVEVLKPLLADSGTRGIRVIAATTHVEYQQFIAPNLPLVERLQRIKLVQPGEEVVIAILKDMCKTYDVEPPSDTIYHLIYEYTNMYIPSTSQPRKSILILDSMIGWHRLTKRPLDRKLLADVIYENEGINVAFGVDASTIKKELDSKVLAQEIATSFIEQRLQICVAGLNNPNRPMSSFLFTGSTGTGKTETTKQLARILYNDDRNLIRFDMTEFANSDSLNRFKSELTIKVSTIPYCIILLDEIEKACPEVTRLLLQVLDDGRLIDDNEREVTFRNAYIIITTNAGNEVYKTISAYEESDKADFKKLEKYDKLIRESIRSESGSKFPPELLGRIDCIVPFQPLSKKTMMRILGLKIEAIANMVKQKHNVTLHVDKNIFVYLIFDKLDTDSDSGGARIVVSKLERELIVPLSRYINEHPFEKEVFISVDGDMAIYDKRQLESKAYVYVGKEFKNENVNLAKQIKLS